MMKQWDCMVTGEALESNKSLGTCQTGCLLWGGEGVLIYDIYILLGTFQADIFMSLESISQAEQGWTGMYTLMVPSLSTKFIKNSHQNLSV